nr:hypothetical protein [Pandoravirus aubagnensis]
MRWPITRPARSTSFFSSFSPRCAPFFSSWSFSKGWPQNVQPKGSARGADVCAGQWSRATFLARPFCAAICEHRRSIFCLFFRLWVQKKRARQKRQRKRQPL